MKHGALTSFLAIEARQRDVVTPIDIYPLMPMTYSIAGFSPDPLARAKNATGSTAEYLLSISLSRSEQ
jgi:hypothetical protein